ncbi:MAG: hypothetical protein H5U40_03275, partial [Polyangiaceae bacterium]|nr:hypothetical protein [Polyangiaceae bacterium]
EGRFRVEAWLELPALPVPSAEPRVEPPTIDPSPVLDAETEKLLKVVEVTLSSLLAESVSPPPLPPPPPAPPSRAARPSSRIEAPSSRADATVRVIYLGSPGPERRTKTPAPVSVDVLPEPERAKNEVDAPRSDPTIPTEAQPSFTRPPATGSAAKKSELYFRQAGLLATVALAVSAALFLAAIAYPFVLG